MAAILRSVWRRLPTRLRRRAFHATLGALAPRLATPAPDALAADAPRVVVGFLSSPSGLGQSARLALRAYERAGRRAYGIDLSHAFYEAGSGVREPFAEGRGVEGAGQVLININAPYMKYVLHLLGRRFLRGKHVTGYWAWELARAPADWRAGLACAHRIAAPSRFVADAIAGLGWRGDLVVAPHPVALEPMAPLPPRESGAPFTITSSFSAASGFVRKNPVALIQAFKRAFPLGAPARLRLLASSLEHYPPGKAELIAAAGGDPRIEFAFETLERDAYWRWYGAPDLFASLHRAEGFGLGLAESMCRGVPVMATDWSANAEYIDADTGFPVRCKLAPVNDPQLKYEGGEWAEADIDHAAALMRQAAEDEMLRKRIAEAGRQRALALFSNFALA